MILERIYIFVELLVHYPVFI